LIAMATDRPSEQAKEPPAQVRVKEPTKLPGMPRDVVKAWEDAGGVAIMVDTDWGFFSPFNYWTAYKSEPPAIPGFHFKQCHNAVLEKLPAPEQPFGLYLEGKNVTDASLKELAAFKNLYALELDRTSVTDEGLKELAPLQNLRIVRAPV